MEADYKSTRKKSKTEQKIKLIVQEQSKRKKNQKHNINPGNNALGADAIQLDSSHRNKVKKRTNDKGQNQVNVSLIEEVSKVENGERELQKLSNCDAKSQPAATVLHDSENESENNNELLKTEASMNENMPMTLDLECPVIDVTNSQETDLVVQIDESSHATLANNESVSNYLLGKAKGDVYQTKANDRSIDHLKDLQASAAIELGRTNSENVLNDSEKENLKNQYKEAKLNEHAVQSANVKTETQKGQVNSKVNNSLAIIREVVKEKVRQRAKKLKKTGAHKITKDPVLVNNKSKKHKKVRSTKKKIRRRPKESSDTDMDIEMQEKGSDTRSDKENYKKVGDFYVCKYCSRKFRWFGPYRKHVVRHNQQEFDCKECGKKFTNYRSVMAHKYNRRKDREFSCELCNFKTTTYCLLRKHSKEKHPSEIFFQCHICPKILKTKSYLNAHLKYNHNINEGKYECHICGHVTKRPKLLEKHMKLHKSEQPDRDEQQHECIDCGKVFQSKLHLRSHSRIHKDRKFLCDFCAKSFCTKTKLREHRMTHTGEKPFKCGKCDYGSTQRGNLRLHMKTHEREEKLTPEKKPYRCQQCNYTVNRVTYFLQHMKTHDKDKRIAEREAEKQVEREVEKIAREAEKRKETAASESVDAQHAEQQQVSVQQDLRSVRETDSRIIDDANYCYSSEPVYNTSLFYRATTAKSNVSKPANSRKTKGKSKAVVPDKEVATSLETQPVTAHNRADLATPDNRTGFSNDVSNDPSLWTPEYFRTYMADQYRSGYQETAPHLMYLNQQRYYDVYSGLYDSSTSKQTQTAEETYSDTKYSTDTTSKMSGAENRPYGSSIKQDLNINLFSSSTGQILRQLLGASQDIYSDSSVSNSYNTRQQYQDTVGAYDMTYPGMYMQHAEGEVCEDANNETQKYADYTSNLALKSDISRPQSNYSTHNFDPYTPQGHDFSSALPAIGSDQLLPYNRKDETSLYQTAATDLSLSETASPVFPNAEQEYSYEDLEHPQSVSGKTH